MSIVFGILVWQIQQIIVRIDWRHETTDDGLGLEDIVQNADPFFDKCPRLHVALVVREQLELRVAHIDANEVVNADTLDGLLECLDHLVNGFVVHAEVALDAERVRHDDRENNEVARHLGRGSYLRTRQGALDSGDLAG